MKTLLWLRDYFTDAEILEYKDNILSKYFEPQSLWGNTFDLIEKELSGKGSSQSEFQGRKRRGNSKAKKHDPKVTVRHKKTKV